MKPIGIAIVTLVCLVIIAASALNVRCAVLRPAANTIVFACSAGRLPAVAQESLK